jgi:NAD(P)-dependent dehydrogenase (short-subunit alcohol dehydrogenase family)
MQKIAIVTGANRGIGFEVCRQLAALGIKVVLTARDENKGREAARKLQNEGLDIEFYQLDVTSEQSIRGLVDWIDQNFKRLDILINNAGILVDRGVTTMEADIDKIRETMETNVYGTLQMCKGLVPLMRNNGFGRIVNFSSGAGSLSRMRKGQPGYCISKASVNVVTRLLANELAGTNITVNSMDPGPVHTDMNPNGERTPARGADTAVWLATVCTETGKFFSDRKEVAW